MYSIINKNTPYLTSQHKSTLPVISHHNSFLAIIYSLCTSLTSTINNHHFLVDIPLPFLIHIPSTEHIPSTLLFIILSPLALFHSHPLDRLPQSIQRTLLFSPLSTSIHPFFLLLSSNNHVSSSSVMTPFHHPSSSNPIGCS